MKVWGTPGKVSRNPRVPRNPLWEPLSYTNQNILNKTKIRLEIRVSHFYASYLRLPHYSSWILTRLVDTPYSSVETIGGSVRSCDLSPWRYWPFESTPLHPPHPLWPIFVKDFSEKTHKERWFPFLPFPARRPNDIAMLCLNRNQISFTIFRLIWNQKGFKNKSILKWFCLESVVSGVFMQIFPVWQFATSCWNQYCLQLLEPDMLQDMEENMF